MHRWNFLQYIRSEIQFSASALLIEWHPAYRKSCFSKTLSFFFGGLWALCGLRGCKNRPAPFPGRMSYKATKPGSVCLISSMFFVSLLIRAHFYVLLVFVGMCCVFWLFWLLCQYLPSDWLERLLWRSLIVARGSSSQSPGRRVFVIFLVYCIVSLFNCACVFSPSLCDIFHTPVARYSLFVLKVSLNTN